MHHDRQSFFPPEQVAAADGVRWPPLDTDPTRAPVTFGWWACTATGRRSRFRHLETFYRLDRVGCGAAIWLTASQYHGLSVVRLEQLLRAREAALLPRLPRGYRWSGPVLLQDLRPDVLGPAALPVSDPARSERLRLATRMATRLLRGRAAGA